MKIDRPGGLNGVGAVCLAVALACVALTARADLGTALDNTQLTWNTQGDADWYEETAVTHDGVDAARSGAVGDVMQSDLSTVVTGPGTLRFWWKVSSQSASGYYDVFYFWYNASDNNPIGMTTIFGEVDWAQKTVNIPAGTYTVWWSYAKDISGSSGADAGFLDQVEWIPGGVSTPTPTAVPSDTATPTVSPTPSISPTASFTPTASPTQSPAPSATPTPLAVDVVEAQATFVLDGGGGGADYIQGASLDSQGRIAVAGFVTSDTARLRDAALYVLAPNAQTVLWSEKINAVIDSPPNTSSDDRFYDVAFDSQDNLVAGGFRGGAYPPYLQTAIVRKYSAGDTKQFLWERTYYSEAWNSATAIAFDGDDNVYVAGHTFTDWGSTRAEWVVHKYSPAGDLQSGFPIRFNYSAYETAQDRALGIAVDGDGNILVVGTIGATSTNQDWHVRKYTPTGQLAWSDTYSGPKGLHDQAQSVAVDADGFVYVVGLVNNGTSNSAGGIDYDCLAIKYAPDGVGGAGQRVWTLQRGETGVGWNERWSSVALDGSGNLLAAGLSSDNAGGERGHLARISAAGGYVVAEQYFAFAVPGGAAMEPTVSAPPVCAAGVSRGPSVSLAASAPTGFLAMDARGGQVVLGGYVKAGSTDYDLLAILARLATTLEGTGWLVR